MSQFHKYFVDKADDLHRHYLNGNMVTGFIAPTGTGKSTELPECLLQHFKRRIIVVQPTIVAVNNLYSYMDDRSKNATSPYTVGMAAEGQIRYTNASNLIYCTGGHMKNVFCNSWQDSEAYICDVLILDEAHRGSLEYELITSLWNRMRLEGRQVPFLILASATLDLSDTVFTTAPIVSIALVSYTVKIEYHDKDFDLGARAIYEETVRVVLAKHNVVPLSNNDAWIVFCPGIREANDVAEMLRSSPVRNLEVLEISSQVATEDYSKIFRVKVPHNFRRIIVATNIAEASITINGLTGVFDTLVEKYSDSTHSGGFRLTTDRISKASARQRAGRVGRTAPGFCYRMATQASFEKYIEQRLPEIRRVPLHNAIIDVLSIGVNPMELFRERTDLQRLMVTYNDLQRLGMIQVSEKSESLAKTKRERRAEIINRAVGSVTEIGTFASRLPLSVHSSAILWHWIAAEHQIFPGIVMVCLIDNADGNYMWWPAKGSDVSEYYEKHFSDFDAATDLEVLLRIWAAYSYSVGSLSPNHKTLSEWCRRRCLNRKKISQLLTNIKQVRNALRRMNYVIETGRFNNCSLLRNLSPILNKVYKDRVHLLGERNANWLSMSNQAARIEQLRPISSGKKREHKPYEILALEITEKGTAQNRHRGQRIISLWMPKNVEGFLPADEVCSPTDVGEENIIFEEDLDSNTEQAEDLEETQLITAAIIET